MRWMLAQGGGHFKQSGIQVMSSRLCKLTKGALDPCQVKPVKDRENDPLHTLHVDKAHHRAGPSADFHEAPLNDIRRSAFAPELARTLKEDQ